MQRTGIVIARDFLEKALTEKERKELPLLGAYVVAMKKPVPSIFVTYGHGGVILPDLPVTVLSGRLNDVGKDEIMACGRLLTALDKTGKYRLRMNLMWIDLQQAEGKVVKVPSDREIAEMGTQIRGIAKSDKQLHKLISRAANRRTTAGIDIPEPEEFDEGKDPDMKFLEDLAIKEQKADKAKSSKHQTNLAETPLGREVLKSMIKGKRVIASVNKEVKPTYQQQQRGSGNWMRKYTTSSVKKLHQMQQYQKDHPVKVPDDVIVPAPEEQATTTTTTKQPVEEDLFGDSLFLSDCDAKEGDSDGCAKPAKKRARTSSVIAARILSAPKLSSAAGDYDETVNFSEDEEPEDEEDDEDDMLGKSAIELSDSDDDDKDHRHSRKRKSVKRIRVNPAAEYCGEDVDSNAEDGGAAHSDEEEGSAVIACDEFGFVSRDHCSYFTPLFLSLSVSCCCCFACGFRIQRRGGLADVSLLLLL